MKLRKNNGIFGGILITVLVISFMITKASAKAEGNLVLEYTFNNNAVGNAAGTIKLSSTSTSNNGAYDIMWASETGILSDYAKITTIDVSSNEGGTYKFVSLNAIPSEASKIVAVKGNAVEAEYAIPQSKRINVNKKFSFGALSDIHLDGEGSDKTKSNSDFQTEIDFFKSKNAVAICNSGDITLDGRSGDIKAVVEKISSAGIPVYTARGNHDTINACASMSEWQKIEPNGIIFEKIINNEVFVFLGMNKADYSNTFSSEQISKLSEILERNKDKRVFLFEHVFFGNVGNVKDLYPYSSLSDSGTAGEFKNLMKKYKNVISFTGHSHLDYELQRISEFANVSEKDDEYGYRVHCPSASKPRKNDADTEDKSENTYTYEEGALGYLVDVYNDYIVLTGRDFTKGKNLPYATYILNTSGYTPQSGNTDAADNSSQGNDASVIIDNNVTNNVEDNTTNIDTSEDVNISEDVNMTLNNGMVTDTTTYNVSGTTDIMLVIDKSMSYSDRFPSAKAAVKSFANNVMSIETNKVRMGITEFGLEAKNIVGLTGDKAAVDNSINNVGLQNGVSGSNMHAGVKNAVEVLKTSSSNTKIIIIISDGRTNRTFDDLENHNREKSRAAVAAELQKAGSEINNLKVITVGYCKEDDDASKKFLEGIASNDSQGSKLYFSNDNISNIFERITNQVTTLNN